MSRFYGSLCIKRNKQAYYNSIAKILKMLLLVYYKLLTCLF